MLLNLFLALLMGCSPDLESTDTGPEPEPVVEVPWDDCSHSIGDHACDFAGLDQNGEPFRLYEQYGEKAVVVDLSAMWCAPCQMAASDVQAVQNQYQDEIVYVTVLIEDVGGEDPVGIDAAYWAHVFEIDAPVLPSNRDFLIDYPLTSWPTFYFIDQDMVIQEVLLGYHPVFVDDGIQTIL